MVGSEEEKKVAEEAKSKKGPDKKGQEPTPEENYVHYLSFTRFGSLKFIMITSMIVLMIK